MDWIRKQAQLYRNLASIGRYQAVIHLEDKEDESFWNYQLQSTKPGRYRFLYYSKSNNGADTHGCEQCLKYRQYLTEKFFICIDSDLRLLRGEAGLAADNHIAQTYAYSWESHYCEASHLCNRLAERLPDVEFDFQSFLTSFSRIVYRPLLYLIRYGADSTTNQLWNVSKFNACIPLQPKHTDLTNNGASFLTSVQENFDKALKCIADKEADTVQSLTEENAYLHIQGHQLYKLVLHIGTMLCKGKNVSFRTDILDLGLHTDGYTEIESVGRDLNTILTNANTPHTSV